MRSNHNRVQTTIVAVLNPALGLELESDSSSEY